MLCPVCVREGKTAGNYTAGRWKAITVPSAQYHRVSLNRMICQTCGYIDMRDVWVNGVYYGPKYPVPPVPGKKEGGEKA